MIRHPRLIALFILGMVLLGLSVSAWYLAAPVPEFIQGEVEATKVNVSAKIPGRVESLAAEEGQRVEAGAVVAVLDSPQLAAKRRQAEGARSAASAQSNKAENGAREEEIRAAYNKYLQAQAGTDLARKSYERVERLFQDGVVPEQRRDEVLGQYEMASKLTAAAKAMHDMALAGAREEDKAAAAALVEQASGAVAEVDSLIEEATVRTPIGGEVLEHVVNLGELASAGMPIMTVVDVDDIWVSFNLREDRLGGLALGDKFEGMVPALDYQSVELEVTYMSALGDFATWRATSAQGGFDLRTFEVRARPSQKMEGLRPGMSVIVPWERVPREDPIAKLRSTMPAWLREYLPGQES
jgi:HlyD family secretion protein